MVEVIGVRFSNAGKIYYFDPKGEKISVGTRILVETARGVEMGHVVMANSEVDDSEIVPPLKPIIRIAEEDDFTRLKENKEKEKEAFIIANEKIAEHGINMKLVDVEYTFDRSKILFYFTADGRVDFRELVKSLAGIFHTRIELRQIGVRDEARQLGSFGICGRYVCCGTFLDDFKPVSIKMAKEQGLSLNPTKISGICGRLMCCLQYEQNVYDEMLKKLPNKGSLIDTPDGKGLVVDVATLKGEVKVKFDSGDAVRFANYKVADINSDEVRVTKTESAEDTAVSDLPDLPEEKIEDEKIEAPH
ncbi:MAG: stage 0 sporulation family protein, partial [Monoglobaceae bacterium]